MIIAIEAKLNFHLLGNLELEFAFMIDFLKRMVLGYYLESRLVSRPHSNATRIRWQDIDMYIHQLVCSLRFMCQVVVCLLLLSYIVPLLHKHISIIKTTRSIFKSDIMAKYSADTIYSITIKHYILECIIWYIESFESRYERLPSHLKHPLVRTARK